MKRKFTGLLALLLAFVLVLTACGGGEEGTKESTGTETSEGTEGTEETSDLEGTISVQVEEGWQE